MEQQRTTLEAASRASFVLNLTGGLALLGLGTDLGYQGWNGAGGAYLQGDAEAIWLLDVEFSDTHTGRSIALTAAGLAAGTLIVRTGGGASGSAGTM